MTIDDYLKQYNRTQDRVVSWLMQNGADRAIATFILDSYANVGKQFNTGADLDNQLLKDCMDAHNKTVMEFLDIHKKMNFKPSMVDRVKAWITKQ
jgi:hypothetical protein